MRHGSCDGHCPLLSAYPLSQINYKLAQGDSVPGLVLLAFHKEEDSGAISLAARVQTRTVHVYLQPRLLSLSLLGCIPENGRSYVKPLCLFRPGRGQRV